MAQRHLIEAQRLDFEKQLEKECLSGRFAAGRLIPPARELAEQFGVTRYVAQSAVKKLEARGIVHTLPRVGTFAGRREKAIPVDPFLMLFSIGNRGGETKASEVLDLQSGFESRIASLGASSISLSADQLSHARQSGEFPSFSGVFDLALVDTTPYWQTVFPHSTTPRVRFSNRKDSSGYDTLSFADEDGGFAATRYLQEQHHSEIAFFAVHPENEVPEHLEWSAARQRGWERALNEKGIKPKAVHLENSGAHALLTPLSRARVASLAFQHAHAFLNSPSAAPITAWVCANDDLASGLIAALESSRVPLRQWPAIVGFDDRPTSGQRMLTSLHLPWEDLGAAAAQLLWERFQDPVLELHQHREIPLQLIPRLSSRTDWARKAQLFDLIPKQLV